MLSQEEQEIKEFIKKCYADILNREVDSKGLESFTTQLKNKTISQNDLIDMLKKSDEFRASFPAMKNSKDLLENSSKKEWEEKFNNENLSYIENFQNNNQEVNFEHEKIFEETTLDPSQARILILGCRNTEILKRLSEKFREMIIIDISIEHVRKINILLKEKQNCIVYENNGKDLSIFSDDYFDICYSFEQLKFVPNKQIVFRFFEEIFRVLKNNGIFVCQNEERYIDTSIEKSVTNFISDDDLNKVVKENKFVRIQNDDEFSEKDWYFFKVKKE